MIRRIVPVALLVFALGTPQLAHAQSLDHPHVVQDEGQPRVVVPEPGTIALLVTGLLGVAYVAKRRGKEQNG